MPFVLPAGTTATLTYTGTGSPISLAVTSITGATQSTAMAETTLLSGTTLTRVPSRLDPGQVQFECLLDDTATVSNALTYIRACQTGNRVVVLALNMPGTAIDTLFSYTGYIMEVTDPQVALGDEALKFNVTMQVSA